ncbi:MAG: hypothetical protein U0359_12600 [Byssovorax sp.]
MLRGEAHEPRTAIVTIGAFAAFAAGTSVVGPARAAEEPAASAAPAADKVPPVAPSPALAPLLARVRPPALTPPPPAPLAWERHLELGADFGMVVRPGTTDPAGAETPVRLRPAPAWGIHLGWPVFRYLHFSGYFIGAAHDLGLPAGSFGQGGTLVASDPVYTYVFGARVMPTYPFTDRLRVWLTAGAGWGKMTYPRIDVTVPGHTPYTLHERHAYIAELPVGIGVTYEVIPRWLNVELGVTAAALLSQQGDALEPGQAIDFAGKKRPVGAAPKLDTSLVQTLGVSLIL